MKDLDGSCEKELFRFNRKVRDYNYQILPIFSDTNMGWTSVATSIS